MAKIELTQQVQWILASTYGWIWNGFTKFTWPTTAERVFTLPDSSSTLLYSWWALGAPASWTLTSCTWLPLTTGVTWILPIANWGTWSATQNFVDLSTNQTVAWQKTYTNNIAINNWNAETTFTFPQISFWFNWTSTYRHYIHTRHNSSIGNNAFDFYTSDWVSAWVYPTNAIHWITIENGKLWVKTTTPLTALDVAWTARVTTRTNPTGWTWMEFIYDTWIWSILTYDRTWWAYKDLNLNSCMYFSTFESVSINKWSAAVASALLELKSTWRGFLPPRMTTTQKNAIASPATLLIVWDTDLNKYQYYTGSAWADIWWAGGWLTWWVSISAGTWIWITMTSTDLAWNKAFQSSTHTASGTLTACTTTQNTYATSRTYTLTSWSVTDNFIWTLFSRTNVTTWTWWTLLVQWPVVKITWTDTQTAWTLTPSYNLLELVPSLRSTWSSINLTVANSVVTAPINGHIYAVLGNTQTVAQTLLKLDTGTSVVNHTWLLIKAYNASSTCYGINIDPSTTCTWAWIYISNTWWNLFKWVKFNSIWSWALVWYWIFQDTVNANSWSTWIWYWIYQSTVQANTWAWIWYWLYQENIKTWSWWWNWYWIYQWTICWWSSTAVGYWIYQNVISTNDSAISYGWYVGNIWNVATSTWKYFSLNNAQSSSSLSARTTNTAEWLFSRTNTATSWTIADNYNWLYFKRTSVQNWAWGTFTSTWSVLMLENVATQTTWTLTDTVTPLLVVQWASSTGVPIKITQWAVVSTNFKKLIEGDGITIWKSNGTTPNGNLTGVAGDLCLNWPSGQTFYCSAAGTTWTGM